MEKKVHSDYGVNVEGGTGTHEIHVFNAVTTAHPRCGAQYLHGHIPAVKFVVKWTLF